MYRDFLRCVRRIEDDDRQKEQAWKEVVDDFRRHSYETDPVTIKMSVREGERRLAQVQSLVGHTTAHQNDEDSWLNTNDPEDPRGRVGVEWPWEK